MKSPRLFSVKKVDLKELLENNYIINIEDNKQDFKKYYIKQQYNQLFRIIKNIKGIQGSIINEVLFVNCKSYKNREEDLKYILRNGVVINDIKYKFWSKSASMGRNGILGFLSEDIYDEVDKRAMMDLKIEKTVLSKFEAYKSLLFSSCFCIEEKLPYMIVVDDYEKIIKNCKIKYVDEIAKTYTDKNTDEIKEFREKIIKDGTKDIKINVNDGAGLCSVEWAEKIKNILKIPYLPSVYMIRLPFVKGLSVTFDFKNFYKELGITEIVDIFGKKHTIKDIDIILTKSQYKGIKYFKKNGDYSDWENYINKLEEYGHCLGISKWNFNTEREPKMTRCNYQILQDLELTSEDLIAMSKYTRDWIEKILNGDILYSMNFLGINEKLKLSNKYMQAIALEQNMLKDIKVRNYIYGLLEKTIDELKVGKFYLNGAFKIIIPDIVFMCQYIAGLEPIGVLNAGEMYSKNHIGEYVLNRNPHISRSEHVILNAVNNEYIEKWCGHLENVTMTNAYDITAPRLNGCDFDGDLVFTHRNQTFMKGIIRDLAIVIDVDDKITAIEKEYNLDNLIEYTLDSLDSRIGEISNCASAYHNKCAIKEENKKKYEDYTCLLSVINGKEIDKAKTGIRWNVPSNISRGARPLPYFMKYKYKNLKKFSKSKSIMNAHCWFIEKWQKSIKYNRDFINTSVYMINKNIITNDEKYKGIEAIYNKFKKEFRDLKSQEKMAREYDLYREFWGSLTKKEVLSTEVDWNEIYDKYKKMAKAIVDNDMELANYVVDLVYNKDRGKYYTFAWNIADVGILKNLQANKDGKILIPTQTTFDDEESREYLGRYYKLVEIKGAV